MTVLQGKRVGAAVFGALSLGLLHYTEIWDLKLLRRGMGVRIQRKIVSAGSLTMELHTYSRCFDSISRASLFAGCP